MGSRSMASSGKFKYNNFEDHTSSTASLQGPEKKNLVSSVGGAQNPKTTLLKDNFRVKASKII